MSEKAANEDLWTTFRKPGERWGTKRRRGLRTAAQVTPSLSIRVHVQASPQFHRPLLTFWNVVFAHFSDLSKLSSADRRWDTSLLLNMERGKLNWPWRSTLSMFTELNAHACNENAKKPSSVELGYHDSPWQRIVSKEPPFESIRAAHVALMWTSTLQTF